MSSPEQQPAYERPPELAGWPVERRLRWGHLSSHLEDQGVLWPDSERQAFDAIKDEIKPETSFLLIENQPNTKQSSMLSNNR